MGDTIATDAPIIDDKSDYSLSFAGKKLAYSLAFWETAIKVGHATSPAATATIEKISVFTSTYGITLHINQPVFDGMLPVFIFALLLMGHDFAKVRTGSKFL